MLLAIALGAALLAAPQDAPQVRATLIANRIAAGASTVLVITVETSGSTPGEIPVPTLPAGLALGPISDFSQLQVAFPGGRRRTTRREVVVVAQEPGRYRIPSVAVEVEGRTYTTPALDLTVTPAAAGPGVRRDGEPPVRLRAWIDPDTLYVGEQLLYRAEAAFPEALRLRQTRAPVFDPPATTGFWVYDLPDPVTVGLRVSGNEMYEVQSFRQVLFPLRAGDHRIPPAGLRYEYRAGSIFSPESRQLATDPIAVHVRELPRSGRPADFDGAVGQFTITASISAPNTTVDDAVTLRVSVEGKGNIKALGRPMLPEIADVDIFPGADRVDVGFDGERVSGRKTFEWLLVSRAAGEHAVPAITFSWFDPQTGGYERASTSPLVLYAGARDGSATGAAALAPLRADSARQPLAFVRTNWFLALQAVPLLLLLAMLQPRPSRRAGRHARPAVAEHELRALADLRDPRASLERLGTLLQREIARDPGAGSTGLRALHERVRQVCYAPTPADAETCARLIADARALLAARRARTARPGALLLGTLLAAGPVAGQTPPAGTDPVATAVAEVRARPDDASAWYDLGHAFAADGHQGPAVWAWLRTLQLEPRARDARHNLQVLGAERALAEIAPAIRVSSDELRLFAAVTWWLGSLLLALALRRRRRLLPAAILVLLAGAAALGVLGVRARPPSHAVALASGPLRAAPALYSDSLGAAAAGDPLRLRELRSQWARVLTYDLREGWVERRSIGRL
ncbi:MAG TPA: BatD family protein [Longimicrobiales bacterium]|nr:BatD family protein [Longimicrobiales bacterium]